MNFRIEWTQSAQKDLAQLGKHEARRIRDKVELHLAKDPLSLSKPLTGRYQGFYRFRIGDYRVIHRINNSEVTVYILKVGHRKDVYQLH